MSDMTQRLDRVRDLIQKPEFLAGQGLSNEVNIHIFCYDPEEEIAVKHFVRQITTDPKLNCNLIECALYKTFLACCEEVEILDAIPEMELDDGSEYLLEQLCSVITAKDIVEKLRYSPHKAGDVLMLTEVGEVFPFVRIHTLLETLQPHFSDVPILVMYPGKFDKRYLKLFNRLRPNEYYRAFNGI